MVFSKGLLELYKTSLRWDIFIMLSYRYLYIFINWLHITVSIVLKIIDSFS